MSNPFKAKLPNPPDLSRPGFVHEVKELPAPMKRFTLVIEAPEHIGYEKPLDAAASIISKLFGESYMTVKDLIDQHGVNFSYNCTENTRELRFVVKNVKANVEHHAV